jgi:hypothetical protein
MDFTLASGFHPKHVAHQVQLMDDGRHPLAEFAEDGTQVSPPAATLPTFDPQPKAQVCFVETLNRRRRRTRLKQRALPSSNAPAIKQRACAFGCGSNEWRASSTDY